MKKFAMFSLTLFCSLILVSGMRVSGGLPSDEAHPSGLNSVDGGVLSSRINVATSDDNELDPAVTYCGNSYLVVYVKDGDIYGQRLDFEGLRLGDEILIFDGEHSSSEPEVACLWPGIFEQYFIVVWTYDWSGEYLDYDIEVQALTTDGNLSGSILSVANSVENERRPAIACEVDDYTCLVVYEKEEDGDPDIKGRRLIMTNFGLDLPEAEFHTGSDSDHDYNPAVTWSMPLEEYQVVWQDWYVDGIIYHDRIQTSSIYEDEHGIGYDDEIKYGPVFLNPPYLTGEHEQEFPDVAFNNHLGRYLVTYYEDRSTTDAAVGDLTVGNTHWGAMDFETDVEPSVVVAYSGGPSGTVNAEDEFLAVNVEVRETFFQLQGTYIWKGNLLSFAKDIPIETTANEDLIMNPDVCGTPPTGHYLVVWEHGQPATGYNIYGRLVDKGGFSEVYLPLIQR